MTALELYSMNLDSQNTRKHIAIFLIFKENLSMPKKTNGLSTGFHISESIYRIFTAHMVE